MRLSIVFSLLGVVFSCAGPPAPETPEATPTAPEPTRFALATDATSRRLFVRPRVGVSPVLGDASASIRLDRASWRIAPATPQTSSDWAMEVGNGMTSGGVDGAPAKLQLSFQSHSCNDVVVVPVDQTGGTNVYAFDRLYDECPSGPPSAGPGLTGKCSPAGHCPHVLWTGSVPAAPTLDSVGVDLAGNAYLPASNGVVYKFAYGTGVRTTFYNAAADAGGAGLTFVATVPWVDFATGNVFLVASRPGLTRVVAVSAAGTRLALADLTGEVAQTSPIFFRGYAYVFTYVTSSAGNACGAGPAPTSGTVRLHRLVYAAGSLTDAVMANATVCGYPLTAGGPPVEVVASPVADVSDPTAPLLFIGVRESLVGVYAPASPAAAVAQVSPIGTGPAPDPASAPCFSSPTVGGSGIVMLGHYQRLWGATYLPPDPLFGQDFVLDPAAPAATSTIDATRRKLRQNSYPASSPLFLTTASGDRVFFGDGFDGTQSLFRRSDTALAVDRTLALTLAGTYQGLPATTPALSGTPYVESDSPVIADFDGGNVYFGAAVSYTSSGLRRRTSFVHQATAANLQ